jgi:hypothetical protein
MIKKMSTSWTRDKKKVYNGQSWIIPEVLKQICIGFELLKKGKVWQMLVMMTFFVLHIIEQ